MVAPVQMTEKTLNALKGWPQPAAVDFHTTFDESIVSPYLPVPPGACVSLNSSGKYILGVGNNSVMPMFTFQASNDPDVQNEAPDPATVRGAFIPINPTGQCMALVAIGAYELVSTHFVTGQTYDPNTALTSTTGDADRGKLKPGTMYTNMIVGIVSRGVVDNGYGYDAVAFWPFPVFPTP
jgi:hypothetical protein